MSPSITRGVYLVADSASTAGRELHDVVAQAVAGGIRTVQLRCKDTSAAEFLDIVLACAKHTAGRADLLINDRVDVYLAARAAGASVQGVHIGQSDLGPAVVRQLIGPAAILGLSAATAQEIRVANTLEEHLPGTITYLGVGAVHATPTKKDHPEPLGHAGLARVVQTTKLPVIAIGGIHEEDVSPLAAAGAAGIAVVRAICAAQDPRAATIHLRTLWEESIR